MTQIQGNIIQLDKAGVMACIPHRPPILLVDEVTACEPGKIIHTKRFFAENDPAFAGHFPGHPILPGVLGVECMAQTSALLVNLTVGKNADETLFLFMGIENARFRQPVQPGDTLTATVEMLVAKRHIYKFKGVLKCGEDVVQEAHFSAKLVIK